MGTAFQSISRAMRLIGVYNIGEQPSADESADGLYALNAMLDSFANDETTIYAETLDVIAWASNTPSYTMGPTGTFVTIRPVSIDDNCYYVLGGVSYPLTPLTIDDYNEITLKTQTGSIPQYIFVDPTFPNSTVTIFPTPSTGISVNIRSTKQLLAIPSLTTDLALPPGYTDFIDYNLAERLAPEYEVPVPPAVAKQAMLTRKVLARTNFIPKKMDYPSAVQAVTSRYNIYSGLPL